ncbi:hypothetical protein H310_00664 [Aphanomyces invadans]|uniref:BEACH domain-containing protein n=1 Tax=Aphanomyces invadans TaxID=157072 RepID=A0A024UWJ8_9STRA|nr:hypothetical protein H310_00664 [Aphanomyces invadans]ETW10340.1 hypothetical protein H310_00664 [Aphanomyces invadans]|eukprot:XP_008861751.1 hypothetical protein H310_00664 [Aphanomyces invadans]
MDQLLDEALRVNDGNEGEMVRLMIDIVAEARDNSLLQMQAIDIAGQLVQRRLAMLQPVDKCPSSCQPVRKTSLQSSSLALSSSASTETDSIVGRLLFLAMKTQAEPILLEAVLSLLTELFMFDAHPTDLIALWRTIQNAGSELRYRLLQLAQTGFEGDTDDACRQVFVMRGQHAGIIAPPSTSLPLKKGYTFCTSIQVDASTHSMALYSFRGENGHGVSASIDGDALVLSSFTSQGSFFNLQVPLNGRRPAMHRSWTHVAIVHAKKMVFKDKIHVYMDGQQVFVGNLPYPDALQMAGGHNCVGATPQFPSFQGQMYAPTLFGFSLSDAEVALLHPSVTPHGSPPSNVMQQWLWENASLTDKSKFVFSYDARVCSSADESICYDVSGNCANGWLEPGTRSLCRSTLGRAIAPLGGTATFLLLLFDPAVSAMEAVRVLRLVASGLQHNRRCRSQYIRWHGSKVVAHLLTLLPTPALTNDLLDAVIDLFDTVAVHVKKLRLRTMVLSLFALNPVWFHAPWACQVRLLESVLPQYITLLEQPLPIDGMTMGVDHWCQFMTKWYAAPSESMESAVCCKIILDKLIDPLLFPKHHVLDESDRWVALIRHLDSRMQGIATSWSTCQLQSICDVQEMFRYFTRTLSMPDTAGLSSPPSRKLIFKLQKHAPLTVWYTWLATPSADVRLPVLQAFEAMTAQLHLRFPDAVLFHNALSPHSIDMQQSQVILDVCLGSRSSTTGTRQTSTPRGHFIPVVLLKLLASATSVDYRMQLYMLYELRLILRGQTNSDIFKEYIRVDPEWLSILLSIQGQRRRGDDDTNRHASHAPLTKETSNPPLNHCQLNDYCMTLCDDTASMETRIHIIHSIGASHDTYGAEFMLTVLDQACAPLQVKQAILDTVMHSFPDHSAQLIESICTDIAVDIIVYSLRNVNHGWLHVLEAYFYMYKTPTRCAALFAAVADALLATSVEDKPLQWENYSQFCSFLALLYFVADGMQCSLPDESSHVALLRKARDLWLQVLSRLPVVAWNEDQGDHVDSVLHQLFATYPLTRRLALYSMFQTIKAALLTTGRASADVGRLRDSFEELRVISVVKGDQITEPTMHPHFLLSVLTELHGLWALAADALEKVTLKELIHSVALEALGRVGTDSELAHALMGITALPPDSSIVLWAPFMQVVSKYSMEAQDEVNSHVDGFVAKWKHLVQTNAVFNVEMTMQDVEQRTVVLSVHTQDVAMLRLSSDDDDEVGGVCGGSLDHMIEQEAADTTATAQRFKSQLEQCLRPLVSDNARAVASSTMVLSSQQALKLSTAENRWRMRLGLKVIQRPMHPEASGAADASTTSLASSATISAMASSWRSDTGTVQGLTDMLSDANVRAVLRTATSSNVEDNERAFDEMLEEDDVSPNDGSASPQISAAASPPAPPPSPFKSLNSQLSGGSFGKPRRKSSADFPAKNNSSDFVCSARLVRQMYIMAGEVRINESELVFYPFSIVDEHDQEVVVHEQNQHESQEYADDTARLLRPRRLRLDDICQIYGRRYLLKLTALEIFIASTRKNYFFHFATTPITDVHSAILGRRPMRLVANPDWKRLHRHPSHVFRHAEKTQLWVNHEISTFEYLMWLNTVSGRTYNDLTQYPVFPWILADYTSQTLDLSRPTTFRDLSKPMGALDLPRLEFFKQRYAAFDDPDIPKFMYGSHYSHIGAVLYYLVRVEPFTSLARRVQGGRFDHADRLFHSIADTWANCLTDTSDLKELTPEWFYSTAFLHNHSNIELGTRQNGVQLHDVVLPPYAASPHDFIAKHMQALESDYVSQHIHLWIDLVFGNKQRGPAALDAHNVFFYLTYEGMVDIDAITDPVLQASMRAQIAHFGQTPSQLLREPHVPRNVPSSRESNVGHAPIVVPLLLPHVHPIALVEFLTSTTLLCLDTTGMVSIQKFSSPFSASARLPSASPTVASTARPTGALSPQRHGGSSRGGETSSIVEIVDRKCRRVLPDYAWLRKDLVWTVIGTAVVTGGHADGTVRSYAISDGAFLGSILHHAAKVTCLVQCNNNALVCGSADGTISAWTLVPSSGWTSILDTLNIFKPTTKRIVVEHDYSPRLTYLGHGSPITALDVREDLDVVVSGSFERCLVHAMSTGALVLELALPPGSVVHAVAVCTVGWIVVSLSTDSGKGDSSSRLRSYSLQGEMLAETTTALPVATLVPFARTGHVVAAGPMGANILAVHSMARVQPLTTVGVNSAALSIDEKFVVLGLDVMPAQMLSISMSTSFP